MPLPLTVRGYLSHAPAAYRTRPHCSMPPAAYRTRPHCPIPPTAYRRRSMLPLAGWGAVSLIPAAQSNHRIPHTVTLTPARIKGPDTPIGYKHVYRSPVRLEFTGSWEPGAQNSGLSSGHQLGPALLYRVPTPTHSAPRTCTQTAGDRGPFGEPQASNMVSVLMYLKQWQNTSPTIYWDNKQRIHKQEVLNLYHPRYTLIIKPGSIASADPILI